MKSFKSWKRENTFKIGVVGYSNNKFDQEKAIKLINKAFDEVESKCVDVSGKSQFDCVSGLTNLGIPALAYKEASNRKWKTTGIACEKANDYELYPVDQKIIFGENWGDESLTFLKNIDFIIRIGGGKQSHAEVKEAKLMGIPVIEYELDLLS